MTYKNIAVLIDADNVGTKYIGAILDKIDTLGTITCKKIYGDWGQAHLSSWQSAILKYAIDPMQQFAYVKGKNATDIALVIEAMDLLHSQEYDAFCLVSSDSDFASLAVRIRKNNVPVYGFGEKKAVSSFQEACSQFFEVETLLDNAQSSTITAWDNKQLKQDTKLLNALRESVKQNLKNDDWANYAQIVSYFKQHHKDIDIKKYGYTKLIHLYQTIDIFSIKKDKETDNLIIRIKESESEKSTTQKPKYTTKQLQSDKLLVNAINELIIQNPKSDDKGWTNISYIASELNKNDKIDLDKYGYKKFSDLMIAIRLFDIKKQDNGVFVKLKNSPNKQPDSNHQIKENSNLSTRKTTPENSGISVANLSSLKQKPLILTGEIDVMIYHKTATDAVLWRLSENNKVRNDGDMIFYGQTHSEDGSILLENDDNISHFNIQLPQQENTVKRLIFTLSYENINTMPNKVVIKQAGIDCFVDVFDAQNAIGELLFYINRTDTGWQLITKSQAIHQDLRALCERFGVEVDD